MQMVEMPSGTLYPSPNATSPDEVKMSFIRSSLLEMALPLSTQTTDIPQLQLVYLSYKSKNTKPPYQSISIHVFAAHMGGAPRRIRVQSSITTQVQEAAAHCVAVQTV
ncbi:hypothetical protein L3X38_013869 [Prunus dulcis]|uniref:Uncharacterized protein n=1 Tax=Prunus dulcis TaxID=3755 RepID=A0AAD4WM55_PRUDU|nr:hypothetical protein L3X38_013869 [Prunus dulcis]